MKVQLHIKPDALIAVHKLLQNVYNLDANQSKLQKVYSSIGFELAEKFEKLYKSKIKSRDLFNHKKSIKLTLKFYQAWALQALLTDMLSLSDNKYQEHHIQTTINQLDQKTC